VDGRPLRCRAFRHVAAAYSINELGNWVGDVALAILVFGRTGSALATAGLFVALRFVPALIAPLVATRLQVLDAQCVLVGIYVVEGLIFAMIGWIASHFSLPALLVLAAVDGVLAIAGSALTRSATSALLLPAGALRQGNAILNFGFAAGGAVGPALAGVLVASVGPGSALVVDAGSFVAVALILATAGGLPLEPRPAGGSLSRLRAGLSEATSRPGVRRLLAAQALALVFFAAVVPIEVAYAQATLHAGELGYGVLLAAWGVGMVIGGIAFAGAPRMPLLVVLAVSTALIGAGYGGLALAPSLAVAVVFSAIGGVGNGAQSISVVTAVQHAVSTVAQSAVMALLGSINQLMPALGFMLGGVLAALASPRATYAVAAVGVLLVLVIAAARRPHGLDAAAALGSAPLPAPE